MYQSPKYAAKIQSCHPPKVPGTLLPTHINLLLLSNVGFGGRIKYSGCLNVLRRNSGNSLSPKQDEVYSLLKLLFKSNIKIK